MKKVLSAILVAVMMFSFMSIGVSAAGDTMATATEVTFGTKYESNLTESDDADFYKIVLSESGKVTINSTIFLDVYLGVYDENGNDVINRYTYYSISYQPMDLYNIVMDLHLTSGVYYIDFRRANDPGEYQVTFTFEEANESFKEEQGGSNETLKNAFSVELNKEYRGQIAKNEEKDFYKFTITDETKVKIGLNVFPYVYCSICDENGQIVRDYRLLGYDYNINTSDELDLKSGTYYLCFKKGNGHCGNYDFTISEVGVTIPDEPSTPSEPTPENPDDSDDTSDSTIDITSIFVAIWQFFVSIFNFILGLFM